MNNVWMRAMGTPHVNLNSRYYVENNLYFKRINEKNIYFDVQYDVTQGGI